MTVKDAIAWAMIVAASCSESSQLLEFNDGTETMSQNERDRLRSQFRDVWDVMVEGGKFTLRALEERTSHQQPSISARLRDFRKAEFGGHTVDRFRLPSGFFEYSLRVNCETSPPVSP